MNARKPKPPKARPSRQSTAVTIRKVSAQSQQSEYQFDLSGGNLVLDFANTVSRRSIPERRAEHLETFADLLAFARQSKLISQHEENTLRALAKRSEVGVVKLFRRALDFRETIYRAFAALSVSKPVAVADLAAINEFSREALAHRELTHTNGGYSWEWTWDKPTELQRVLWPIAQSAADLLTSNSAFNVRKCEADDCDWLFLDNSRNHSRRWCEMKSCGNRAKARRHYQRSHDS